MANKKLIWYILPTYFLLILISLVPVSIFMISQVRTFYIDQKITELQERAYLIENQILNNLSQNPAITLDSLCRVLGKKAFMRITVILNDGTVIGDSDHESKTMNNHSNRPEVITALKGEVGSSIRFSNTIKKDFLYVAVLFHLPDKSIGVLRTSVQLTYIESTVQSLQNNIIFVGSIIAILAAIISFIVAKRITNPIENMELGIEKFANGELTYQLPSPSSKELSKLADSLNKMAAQLHDKITEIVEQKNEQQAVFESMVEAVVAVDKQKNILNSNRAAQDMFNMGPDATGKSITDFVKNKDLLKLINKTLKEKNPIEEDIILQKQNKHYLQGNGTVLKNAQGKIVGALIVINDVTRLRRLEKVRQDFVANVSHEIRTPLTSIKGFAETLLDGAINDPKQAMEFVKIISSQSDRLNSIIEDLLILARLEQDNKREYIKFSEAPLKKILKSALQICAPAARDKNINIELKCESEIKLKLNPDLFEQAIVNLIDNAIKYSPKNKEIQVLAKKTTRDVQIIVSDQGAGIEKKHLPRLFERFYRVDKARSRNLGGTGLGLAIVKHIAQVHNANISVESTPGVGSRFKIHFPINAVITAN